jgi:hypothetical protein
MSASAPSLRLDSLLTGLFYLGLGATGATVFMAIRPELFADGEPARTLANLIEKESLARIGVALELGMAAFQALVAVWFVRLFRHVDMAAAMMVALFGMVNAVATLASSALLRAALDAALGPTGADPSISHLLILMSHHFWSAGAIFFGLWLLPMGWLVLKSGYGPRVLGWILIIGGIGYVASVFIAVLAPDAGIWVVALPVLATVGEFWMIGLLFWKAMRGAQQVGAVA